MGVRTPLGRSCQGLPYFCHISREPTQMSHQSCDQCCVRSKENIHFALAPKNESTFALDLGFPWLPCPFHGAAYEMINDLDMLCEFQMKKAKSVDSVQCIYAYGSGMTLVWAYELNEP